MRRNIGPDEKNNLLQALRDALKARAEIGFAYVHGSFASGESFNDIDIAIFTSALQESPLEYELSLESELSEAAGSLPVDVRLLNGAPLSFRYSVIRTGVILLARDDEARVRFQEETCSRYFDFAPHREKYLMETLGSGV